MNTQQLYKYFCNKLTTEFLKVAKSHDKSELNKFLYETLTFISLSMLK